MGVRSNSVKDKNKLRLLGTKDLRGKGESNLRLHPPGSVQSNWWTVLGGTAATRALHRRLAMDIQRAWHHGYIRACRSLEIRSGKLSSVDIPRAASGRFLVVPHSSDVLVSQHAGKYICEKTR